MKHGIKTWVALSGTVATSVTVYACPSGQDRELLAAGMIAVLDAGVSRETRHQDLGRPIGHGRHVRRGLRLPFRQDRGARCERFT
ncbi:hypothetical protein M2317_001634 [Microbacterium sp. ZKA21]|uniref:hypothetical protein n=1 Tax=Microbacterium sp. ZKA21 TaxID=3381694 RepID=UPI003D23AB5F